MGDIHFPPIPVRPAESDFPLPEGDLLDLDFDFDSTDFLDEAFGLIDTPMDSMLDQQYGAVAALATQVNTFVSEIAGLGGARLQKDVGGVSLSADS